MGHLAVDVSGHTDWGKLLVTRYCVERNFSWQADSRLDSLRICPHLMKPAEDDAERQRIRNADIKGNLKLNTSQHYVLTLLLFTFCTCILRCIVCIVVSCLVCITVVVLCVLLSSYVYLLYYVCIAVFYFRCRTAG